jgi:CRP-like cAMP-binding protein
MADADNHERLAQARLAASPLMRALSVEASRRMAAAGRPIALEPGQPLFAEGDPPDAIYVVIDGELEVLSRMSDGRELRYAAAGAGEIVGEMAVLDGSPRSASVVAARRTTVWRVPHTALTRALQAEPAAALVLIRELARRLRAANLALQQAAMLGLGPRLAQLLTSEASANGLVTLTQTEMGRRIAASREKVNRKLHAFAEAGWIELSRSGVKVLDRPALAAVVEREIRP